MLPYTADDIDTIESWWVEKSRVNFLAYRMFLRSGSYLNGWFMSELAKILQNFYLDFKNGERPVYIINTPPQHGKQIDNAEPVLTTKGFKLHGKLEKGDMVYQPNGTPVEITDIIQQVEPCNMVVSFSNNQKIICHENHEWAVTSHDWAKYKVMETKQLLAAGIWQSGSKGKRGSRARYQVEPIKCLKFETQRQTLNPYFLGAWLGDGHKNKPTIHACSGENEIIDYISKIIPYSSISTHKKTGVRCFYFGNNGETIREIRALDLYENKHIPCNFLYGNKEQRLQLLAGLIDTDGSLHKKTGQYRFINTNIKLIEDIQVLLSTLGYTFSVTSADPRPAPNSAGIQDRQVCYQIGFTPHDIIPCQIKRKQSTKKPIKRKVSITDVSFLSADSLKDGRCVTVDNTSGVYLVGKKLIPTHNSIAVTDLISWIAGQDPTLKIIYSSYAERLGKRCNSAIQKTIDSDKYTKIFPDLNISQEQVVTRSHMPKRNSEFIEFVDKKNLAAECGYFRNTTIGGAITGDSMSIGVIDDAVKGRKEARSVVVSQSIWDWFEDDFDTRLSEFGGVLIIMTRWMTHDLTARLIDINSSAKIFNFQALATDDEKHRKAGEPLFPELKSKEFLENKKARTSPEGWESLYQGNPTVTGGNMIKDHWWQWWKILPPIKFKFITADTAQKAKTQNDWTDFKAWGYGLDGNLYCLDHLRAKLEAPELRKEAYTFYKKHDTKRMQVGDPILRGMYIEDKSSGTGLIQELKRKGLKIYEVPRSTDKIFRAEDATPYIESGRVFLNVDIPDIGNTTKEGREFPNGEFDDDIDNVFTAIEIVFINKKANGGLKAAMEATD